MKLSGTIGVTQKTMTLDTHVRLILLQTLNPQERWGTHKKRWPFQPRLFADVMGLVRCSYVYTYFSFRYLLHVTLFLIIPWSYFCCYRWCWFCCCRPQNVGPEVDSCVTGVTPASLVLTTEAVPLRCDATVMAGQPVPPNVIAGLNKGLLTIGFA